MQARALCIGVENYNNGISRLPGSTRDAEAVGKLLETHGTGKRNMAMTYCTKNETGTSKALIENEIEQTLASDASLVVIYFSGHGTMTPGGDFGQIVASDHSIDMYWLMGRVNAHNGKFRSTVVILDCCHAGALGLSAGTSLPLVQIERGVTLMAAADSNQDAVEEGQYGRFTKLLLDGLGGGSADLAGRITPAALYAHIDQAIGHRGQRPVFATNIQRSTVLRECEPPIELEILKSIPEKFPEPDYYFPLDPGYESDRGEVFCKPVPSDPGGPPLKVIPFCTQKNQVFKHLQAMVKCGLVRPVMHKNDELKSHMFWAAVGERGCALTELGQHYWRLAKQKEI